MNGQRTILMSFLVCLAIITFQSVKNPVGNAPLPLPPPYRYTGAGVAFGLLSVVGSFLDDRIPAIIAIGLTVGITFNAFKGSGGPFTGYTGAGLGSPVTGTAPTAPSGQPPASSTAH